MRGLFWRVPRARERACELCAPLDVELVAARPVDPRFGELLVLHHADEWPKAPFYEDAAVGVFIAVSGWFVFRGVLNDLTTLGRALEAARDVEAVAREIEAGAFIMLVDLAGERSFVTDAFGLHPHYTTSEGAVAPSPWFLRAGKRRSPLRDEILRTTNHLFGNATAYEGIERLEPGAVIGASTTRTYADYLPTPRSPRETIASLAKIVGAFRGSSRLLPLSGGLDSRLLLAAGDFDFSYTFGPKESGDRPVARQFAHRFREHRELSLLDLDYREEVRACGLAMLDGLSPRPFVELLEVYRWARRAFGPCAYFDGYLGDVLQRGLYLTHGGLRGALAKVFPPLTLGRFDAAAFLRRKYARLDRDGFDFLMSVFEEKMSRFDLDSPHRVVLFDVLYGRGARYVVFGGTVLSSQFFASVTPFATRDVFSSMFASSAPDWLSYRAMARLWREVAPKLGRVPTYSGFVPTWNPHRSRLTMLVTKALGRAGLWRRSVSYESELLRVTWRGRG